MGSTGTIQGYFEIAGKGVHHAVDIKRLTMVKMNGKLSRVVTGEWQELVSEPGYKTDVFPIRENNTVLVR